MFQTWKTPPAVLHWFLLPFVLVVLFFLIIIFLLSTIEAVPRKSPSHARSNMRSLAMALESYYVDNNCYPAWTVNRQSSINGGRKAWDSRLDRQPTFMIAAPDRPNLASLTTPVSYLTAYLEDPLGPRKETVFSYYSKNDPEKAGWILWSAGPDRDYDLSIDNIPNIYDPADTTATLRRLIPYTYDPTNGSNSDGDIWHAKRY